MEGLYIGSVAAAKNLEGLKSCDITHVVNASPIGKRDHPYYLLSPRMKQKIP